MRGDVVARAEQDRADEPVVGDHELAVAAVGLVDDDLVAGLLVDAPDAGELDADDLEHRRPAAPGRTACRRRPRSRAATSAWATAVGHRPGVWPPNSAMSPAARMSGSPVRMRSSTSTPRLTASCGVARELDVGLDARRHEQDLRRQPAAVLEIAARADGRCASTDSTSGVEQRSPARGPRGRT